MTDSQTRGEVFRMLTKLYVRTRNLMDSDEGATAVEYGVMVALIAAVIVGIVAILGEQIADAFQTIVTELGG